MAQVDKRLGPKYSPAPSGSDWQYIYGPVGEVTSRDQIINPYDVIDVNNYRKNRAGQAQYAADLAAAQYYAQQQEAAYQDWYNSAEQQAIRERQAGLNPDLTDFSGAEAAQTQGTSINPMEGIPTTGEVVNNAISSITSVVSSLSAVANLATAFTEIDLNKVNTEGEELSNIEKLSQRLSGDISGLLGTAVQAHVDSGSTDPFNYSDWFGNDSNFESLKGVYGGFGSFGPALALARQQSLKYHSEASKIQKDAAQNDWDFSNIIADPRYSTSQKLTAIQVRPFMKASQDLEQATVAFQTTLANWNNEVQKGMSTQSAIDAANAQFEASEGRSEYEREYYNNSDGAIVAAFDKFMSDVQQTAGKLEMSINQGYQKMYDSDPNGIGGTKAAYLYGSKGGASWTEAYYTNAYDSFVEMIEADETIKQAIANNADLRERLLSLAPIMNTIPGTVRSAEIWFNGTKGASKRFSTSVRNYINSLAGIADSIE